MTTLHLTKLHATGNDFLVHPAVDGAPPKLAPAAVALLCDRHRGIGADGLITITPGKNGADCTMSLLNADGGAAEMSGNGIRCLAYVAAQAGLGTNAQLIVDTDGGRRAVALTRNNAGEVVAADVDMGPVTLGGRKMQFALDGVEYVGDAADVGNPHVVCFVDDPDAVPVTEHGPKIERDPRFARGANVEFVAVNRADMLIMRVWERGAGETLSCGTGACAAAAVAHAHGLVGEEVVVAVRGGELTVALGPTVRLGGPVAHVFDVDIEVA
jgi:diaminopimelate epimerase